MKRVAAIGVVLVALGAGFSACGQSHEEKVEECRQWALENRTGPLELCREELRDEFEE